MPPSNVLLLSIAPLVLFSFISTGGAARWKLNDRQRFVMLDAHNTLRSDIARSNPIRLAPSSAQKTLPQNPAGYPPQYPVDPNAQNPAGYPPQNPAGPNAQNPAGYPPQNPAGPNAQNPAGYPPQYPVDPNAQNPAGYPPQYPVDPNAQNPAGYPPQYPSGYSAPNANSVPVQSLETQTKQNAGQTPPQYLGGPNTQLPNVPGETPVQNPVVGSRFEPAANMQKMKWDEKLQRSARNEANRYCKEGRIQESGKNMNIFVANPMSSESFKERDFLIDAFNYWLSDTQCRTSNTSCYSSFELMYTAKMSRVGCDYATCGKVVIVCAYKNQ